MAENDEKKNEKQARKLGRAKLMGNGQKRKLVVAVLEGLSLPEALTKVGATAEKLNNTRDVDPEWAARLEQARLRVVEDVLIDEGTRGKITAARTALFNRDPGRWAPDIGLSLAKKEEASRRPSGADRRPVGMIINRPASLGGGREIVTFPWAPRELPAPTAAEDVLPIEGEFRPVEQPASVPAEQLVEGPAPAEQADKES